MLMSTAHDPTDLRLPWLIALITLSLSTGCEGQLADESHDGSTRPSERDAGDWYPDADTPDPDSDAGTPDPDSDAGTPDPDPDPGLEPPADSVEGDRQALMDLYEATDGDGWSDNSGWGTGDPGGSWYGVEVDDDGRVVRLDLFENDLTGELPDSIGDLTRVRYLNVKANYLTGEIPASIGNMRSLQTLILAGRTYEIGGTRKEPPENLNHAYHQGKRYSNTNDFSGPIPSTVGLLSNLELLEISNQPNVIGPIPPEIGDLSNLKGLYLGLDDFSGTTIPPELGNLSNLKHLYIPCAQLEGDIPDELGNLTQLTHINFGKSKNTLPANHLTGEIPDFSEFTELRSIIFTNNELTGEWPHYWNNGEFTQLNTLRFTWNNLTGTLHGFENLQGLHSLGLEGNNLTGEIGEQLIQLPDQIQIIGLGWNQFEGELPQNGWPDFYQLKTLYLNDNNLSGHVPADFWNNIDNPRLNYCWISNNDFTSNDTAAMNAMTGDGDIMLATGGNDW